MFPERRESRLRHKVNGPVFANFDGVTGGMILDLQWSRDLSMHTRNLWKQTVAPNVVFSSALERHPDLHLETTAIAWRRPRSVLRTARRSTSASGRMARPQRRAQLGATWHSVLGSNPGPPICREYILQKHVRSGLEATGVRISGSSFTARFSMSFTHLETDLNSAAVISECCCMSRERAAHRARRRGSHDVPRQCSDGGPPLGTHVSIGGTFGECICACKSTAL